MSHDTPFVKRAYNLGLKAVPNFCTLTPEQVAYYEQHLDEIPTALARGFIDPAKFALLVDLGNITVPDDYVHATRLATFGEKNSDKFWYFNDEITDEHFACPSRILKPGDRLWVRAIEQVVSGVTVAEERMAFLAMQKASHTGAQGASLVFEQKRNRLPKGKWYASFDEKKRLWEDADRGHRVPGVCTYSDGDFSFDLGSFEFPWDAGLAFLCFCDVE
ncbi:MAG: hypothetical protein KBD21_00465 [Candidatus Pacebacteria bacterium]|nr:hypothetical protein [Candidatus Paceibacterota bacterium]